MFSSIRDTVRDREMMRTIFCLAWPTVMEQALQTVVQYADTAQVGAIGANASAAVGLTTTMMSVSYTHLQNRRRAFCQALCTYYHQRQGKLSGGRKGDRMCQPFRHFRRYPPGDPQ